MRVVKLQYHETEIGKLQLGSLRGRLCLLGFATSPEQTGIGGRVKGESDAGFVEQDDAVLEKTRKQIDEYLSGSRREFDIPLLLLGTDFQRSVWNALLKVPYGVTASYSQIARVIGKEKAVRAVGSACGANPIAVVIPCHRIVGSGGNLGGYGGGLALKERLLRLEQRTVTHWPTG